MDVHAIATGIPELEIIDSVIPAIRVRGLRDGSTFGLSFLGARKENLAAAVAAFNREMLREVDAPLQQAAE
jgi:hypothetical protein